MGVNLGHAKFWPYILKKTFKLGEGLNEKEKGREKCAFFNEKLATSQKL